MHCNVSCCMFVGANRYLLKAFFVIVCKLSTSLRTTLPNLEGVTEEDDFFRLLKRVN